MATDKEKIFDQFMKTNIKWAVGKEIARQTRRNMNLPEVPLDEVNLEEIGKEQFFPAEQLSIIFGDQILYLQSEYLKAALEKLPYAEYSVIIYRLLLGYSYEEIGEIMHIKTDSAKKYKRRGMKKLQKHLEMMQPWRII